MKIDEVIEELKQRKERYLDIKSFSELPGIYAVFFHGVDFPFNSYKPKPSEIIYIGKTESSQKSRDKNTHFATGKTGSSTLRKTFGAFLRESKGLKPIPRGQSDIDKGRTSHFKFANKSEEIITQWMQNNLGLSFFEYDWPKDEIDALETKLIANLIPILNIDKKNPDNPYLLNIKALRKRCCDIAYSQTNKVIASEANKATLSHDMDLKSNSIVISNIHKYEDIWQTLSGQIFKMVEANGNITLNIGAEPFEKVGNRKSYSFRLEYINGVVSNNIGGSAVARDLARILDRNNEFYSIFKGKKVVFKLNKVFSLEITIS